MRPLLTVLLFVATAGAQAAVVTFEELAAIPPVVGPTGVYSVTSGDYVFSTIEDPYFALAVPDDGPTGNYLRLYSYPSSAASLRFSHISGQAFALQSFDLWVPYTGSINISGHDNFGNEIATVSVSANEWANFTFNEDWGFVYSVEISQPWFEICDPLWPLNCTYTSAPVNLDNVVANVVPVPAAVWLLGSALVGLGRFKRQQSFQA